MPSTMFPLAEIPLCSFWWVLSPSYFAVHALVRITLHRADPEWRCSSPLQAGSDIFILILWYIGLSYKKFLLLSLSAIDLFCVCVCIILNFFYCFYLFLLLGLYSIWVVARRLLTWKLQLVIQQCTGNSSDSSNAEAYSVWIANSQGVFEEIPVNSLGGRGRRGKFCCSECHLCFLYTPRNTITLQVSLSHLSLHHLTWAESQGLWNQTK